MQSCGQQLPSHQSLQADTNNTNQQRSLDLEAQKVTPSNAIADIYMKIEENKNSLVGGDLKCFMIYMMICVLAGGIYILQGFAHFRVYRGTAEGWTLLATFWLILQYVPVIGAILYNKFYAAVIAVVLSVINLLLLIVLVVKLGLMYHYSTHFQIAGASEGIQKIVERLILQFLIASIVILSLQLFINLPLSIKVLILLKRKRSLETELAKANVQQSQT